MYEDKHQQERDKVLKYMTISENSSVKGQQGEEYTFHQLNLLFPKYQVEDTHHTDARGDFLVQKEVAEKIAGKVGTKSWGKLAIKIAAFFDNEILFDVPPEAFDIKPKVNSSFIRLMPNKNLKENINQKDNFFKLIDLAFSSRRKNIKNNLKSLSINWNEVEIDPTKRPEEISLNDYLLLSKVLVL